MKVLTSGQTFITKYIASSLWMFGSLAIAVSIYTKFGQIEGFYFVPFGVLMAILSYLPVKISYDETKIVISDWIGNEEYKFEDLKSFEYPRSRMMFSYHPYYEIQVVTKNNKVRRFKFIPRPMDSLKSLFSREGSGRLKELLDFWRKHDAANHPAKVLKQLNLRMKRDPAPKSLYYVHLLAAGVCWIFLSIFHLTALELFVRDFYSITFYISSVVWMILVLLVLFMINKCRYVILHSKDEHKYVAGNIFFSSSVPTDDFEIAGKVWMYLFKAKIEDEYFFIFASENSLDLPEPEKQTVHKN